MEFNLELRETNEEELDLINKKERKIKRKKIFNNIVNSYRAIIIIFFNVFAIYFFYLYFKNKLYKTNFNKIYGVIWLVIIIIVFIYNIKSIIDIIKLLFTKKESYALKVCDVTVKDILYYNNLEEEFTSPSYINTDLYAYVKDNKKNECYIKMEKPYTFFNEDEKVLCVVKEYDYGNEIYLLRK